MKKTTKIGIIICDRYRDCAGGKCFRSMKNREGAFSIYGPDENLELIGYTTCRGCPGGNIEYVPQEMINNGVDVIHLATGFVVGYPPCPYIEHFRDFIKSKYGIPVVIGTHPIPEKYYITHSNLKTWESVEWQEMIQPTLTNQKMRLSYN